MFAIFFCAIDSAGRPRFFAHRCLCAQMAAEPLLVKGLASCGACPPPPGPPRNVGCPGWMGSVSALAPP